MLKKITLPLFFIASLNSIYSQSSEIKVMSFNILFTYLENDTSKEEGNRWVFRKEHVLNVVRDYQPDIIGMQEVYYDQHDDFQALLQTDDFFKKYGYAGDHNGHKLYDPILYKKEALEITDKGRFWFSQNPDQPNSIAWGTTGTMICAWVKFRVKATGKIFYLFNSHMPDPPLVQLNSVLLLLQKVNEIAGDYPVLMTGDFNFNHDEDGMDFITHTPRGFKDSNCEASKMGKNLTLDILTTGGWGPYTDRTPEQEFKWGIMDHIFYTDPFQIESYAIDTTT